ncbi:MAG: hypothetical protein ACYDCQ_12040 [Dehalococcoidia bacterium]
MPHDRTTPRASSPAELALQFLMTHQVGAGEIRQTLRHGGLFGLCQQLIVQRRVA